MKLSDMLNELHATLIGREYGDLRKTTRQVRSTMTSKLPPGVRDLWRVGDKNLPKKEADRVVTKALLAAKIPSEKLDRMDLEKKLYKARELKLKL